jgi:hypothetical protein
MKGYLTIQEVVQLTKRSDSTIRRWLMRLNKHDQKYIKRDGSRLFIEQSFVMQAFGIEDGLMTAEISDYSPEHHQPDIVDLLKRQQDNIDRLLEDNMKKDADLKDAWSVITRLKEETIQLTYQLKALKEGSATSDKADYSLYAIILLVILILIMLYFVLS